MRDDLIPRRRWVRWGLALGLWTLLGLSFSLQLYFLNARVYGRPIPWGSALGYGLADWYVWAAIAPLVLKLTRLLRRDGQSWPQALRIHLPACVLASLTHPLLLVTVTQLLWRGSAPAYGFFAQFQSAFAAKLPGNLLTYWTVVGAGLALDYYHQFREREVRSLQLEAQLAQAQLQALKAQLHPHFLFNTLHAISALMYTDLDGADRMIARLSELLRLTLHNAGAQEVSLKQELEFLERYLEIEQTRFADRLVVNLEIDPAALDAQVPNLMLQPLVENAIRHGVAGREQTGRIEVHARRQDGTLAVEVRDDGPGLPAGLTAPPREGIGLANTRARLAQLHGRAHRFELVNAPGGGLVVSVTIPFKTAGGLTASH